ncbi:MAG TPA: AAA family ATPase [Nocardioidaceae bacterium]|nr:AAA family ATPase [Nocardioidaceae bacterium]
MAPDDSAAVARPDIGAEQAHLVESRRALGRMRDRTASMSALGGDRVSNEYLQATLWRRMRALEDDPEVPLFFGRLDYGVSGSGSSTSGERFYVGRRHVSDEHGEPMVVDWRAPVSRPFYRASAAQPMGLRLRRRFGFSRGMVTAFEDEVLVRDEPESAGPAASATSVPSEDLRSAILEAEIERPRVGPMRDIVATIQPEQDDIVRADLGSTVCVQGAPGTGKTAVGLHRAAYLLYAHRDQLRRQGVLVVGPNASFLRYIGDVLPALGEVDARQTTLEDLVAHVPLRGTDEAAVARLKGDARMATVLDNALWSLLRPAAEGLVVPVGARRFRVPAYQADDIVAELRQRRVRYGAGRAMLPQRLAHAVLVKMELAGDSPDDRVQSSIARSKPVRAFAESLWPAVDPRRLVLRLLSDADFLATVSAGVLTDEERASLLWVKPPKSPGSARWSLHDAVLIDEAHDLLERTPSLGHVVLDEAQDLSPMMLRSVGRQCSTGSATVLGDLAQATTAWSIGSWPDALTHLGKPSSHVEELTLGFRVPGDVIDFAARLLPIIAPSLRPPTSVRRARGELRFIETSTPLQAAADTVAALRSTPGSIGLIVPDAVTGDASAQLTASGVDHALLGDDTDAEATVDVVPASLAKGLEFDHVVLVEPAALVAAEADDVVGLRRLYVCLTRAVTSLAVVHALPLPTALTRSEAIPVMG